MKLNHVDNWAKKKELEPLLFFAQRLDELLFDYTLDTYKAPALNAPYLCQEALDLIADIEAGNIDAANLDHVLGELEWSLRNDNVAKQLIGVDLSVFFPGAQSKLHLSKQKVLLEIVHKSVAPDLYLLATQEALLTAIGAGEKNTINTLARNWVATLTNVGVSKTHLFQHVSSFFFRDRKIDSLDEAKVFFAKSLPYLHNFEVYFSVNKEISEFKTTLTNYSISILDRLPEDLLETANQNKFEIGQNDVIVEVSKINSYDIYSGRRQAEETLERVRDLALLYSHKRPISWNGIALVRQCCRDQPVATQAPKSAVQKIADLRPSIAAPRLAYLVENLSLDEQGDREKFDRIVDLHGLCAIQDAPETQLLNLWICIESLIPTEPTRNKITNIIDSAVPVLMLLYVRRLIKNLLRDLLEWDKKFVKNILRQISFNSEEKLAHKVLLLLAAENENLRVELFARLDDFPLLRYRIFSMATVFSDHKKFTHMLSEHRKKLEWQIRRIYRTRNLIVHSGRSPNYIPTLIENSHDYLDSIVFEVLEVSCSTKRIASFKQAFELFKIQFLVYEKNLRAITKFDSNNLRTVYYSKQPRNTADEAFALHESMLTAGQVAQR
jgi:hypothetical protein